MKGRIFVKIPAFCEFSLFCVFLWECFFFRDAIPSKNSENEKNWFFLFVINYYYGLKTSFLVAIPPTYLHYTINTIIFVRSKPKISENPRKSVKINENQWKSTKINGNQWKSIQIIDFLINQELFGWSRRSLQYRKCIIIIPSDRKMHYYHAEWLYWPLWARCGPSECL